MYQTVPRADIIDAIVRLNELHRQVRPTTDRERRAYERREAAFKTLLSNLPRTREHPTLNSLLEIAEIFSLTIEGAHRLFGYNLASLFEYDLSLNSGRTHIVESYRFERDHSVDLPAELAIEDHFHTSRMLRDLILRWQTDVPVRDLDAAGWRRPGTFYVHVGTEDSLGSSLPAGALALVEPVDTAEAQRPDPRSTYLLQFGNGYRCSRCVLTGKRLHLLTSDRHYQGALVFAYPEAVRIAGRIRTFALRLPAPEYPPQRPLPFLARPAALILPWEHARRDLLFATKHSRFELSKKDELRVRERLEAILHTEVSPRTERRYRRPSASHPHVDVVIYLTVLHMARYTDALRTSGARLLDTQRFSLQTLLSAQKFSDLERVSPRARLPTPREIWEPHRREFLEWPSLLAQRPLAFQAWGERVFRLAETATLKGLEPQLAAGSWMLLEPVPSAPEDRRQHGTSGWSRPIYVLRKGIDTLCGYLEREGDRLVLLTDREDRPKNIILEKGDVPRLHRVSCVAVATGYSLRYIGDVERGSKSATLRTMNDVATLLGLRLGDLVSRAEQLLNEKSSRSK